MDARHYVRCHDCLSICVIDCDPRTLTTYDKHGTRHGLRCSLCDGYITYMGEVRGSSGLSIAETVCKCNEECISARGPICTCKCGGANHGHGLRAGYVTIQTPSGPVPRVTMPDSVKARQVADVWRAARESVAVRYRELAERKDHREWMPPAEFRRYCDLRDVLHRADTMTSQAGRLRVLATVAP